MLHFEYLGHAQRFHVGSVGVKDDVFDVGDGHIVPVEFDEHFPLAVLERKQWLVREGRSGALGKGKIVGKLLRLHCLWTMCVYKPTAQPRGRWSQLVTKVSGLGNKSVGRRETKIVWHPFYRHLNVFLNFSRICGFHHVLERQSGEFLAVKGESLFCCTAHEILTRRHKSEQFPSAPLLHTECWQSSNGKSLKPAMKLQVTA